MPGSTDRPQSAATSAHDTGRSSGDAGCNTRTYAAKPGTAMPATVPKSSCPGPSSASQRAAPRFSRSTRSRP
ncbi:hypothetical protein [Streptomyces antibioticus]|uniref:hypothetical protein n=1 Tax=Streptomyces antibioticus TaxID=1890 RepID=UPI0033EB46D7